MWIHYGRSKRRQRIAQWRSVVYHRNEKLNHPDLKIRKLATPTKVLKTVFFFLSIGVLQNYYTWKHNEFYFVFSLYPIPCWDLACLAYCLNTITLYVWVCAYFCSCWELTTFVFGIVLHVCFALFQVSETWTLPQRNFIVVSTRKIIFLRGPPAKFGTFRRPYLHVTRWTRSVLEVNQSTYRLRYGL